MGKKKRGKSARNARKGLGNTEPEELVKAPHSFVINRGKLGKNANELMLNFRKIMEPFTASQLKVQKRNVIKDFVHMAGPLNVSHLVIFTKTKANMYLRIAKLPRGPTLTFQIKEYSLIRDIISSQKKPLMYDKLFDHHPLIVLNKFSGEGMHLTLMATMFQNMFPTINVNKTNLNTIRRCLLLQYNSDETIDLRQYAIKIVPCGISKAVKKLINNKVPDMSQYQNIDEFLKSGNFSESEVEEATSANTVTLPQPISSRGNIASEKSAVRLYEIGPRLKLELLKIEEGLMTGDCLYHRHFGRTPEELKALKEKRLLKEKQKKNVQKKKKKEIPEKEEKAEESASDEGEEDRQWYRREVGEEPDEDVLPGFKRKHTPDEQKSAKKKKVSHDKQNKTEKSDEKSGKSLQEFLKRRKKRKEAKLAKKKAKRTSAKVLSIKAKHREPIGKSKKKKN